MCHSWGLKNSPLLVYLCYYVLHFYQHFTIFYIIVIMFYCFCVRVTMFYVFYQHLITFHNICFMCFTEFDI